MPVEKEAWYREVVGDLGTVRFKDHRQRRADDPPMREIPGQPSPIPAPPKDGPSEDVKHLESKLFSRILPYAQRGLRQLSEMWGSDTKQGKGYADLAEHMAELEAEARRLRGQ